MYVAMWRVDRFRARCVANAVAGVAVVGAGVALSGVGSRNGSPAYQRAPRSYFLRIYMIAELTFRCSIRELNT